MAGIRGNQAGLAFAKQSGKGVTATAAGTTPRTALSGGNIAPVRSVDSLSETDNARDAGDSYIQAMSVAGTPEVYVRDSNIHFLLEAAMGSKVTSGTTNLTETLTLSNALAYWTFWKDLGGTLFETFTDCMVNEITVSAEAGGPLTASVDVIGRSGVRTATQPAALPATVDTAPVYNFNEAAVTLAGGATALVSSFEMTLTNNVSLQQTDDAVPYDVVPGLRVCTLAFDLIFETLDEYNRFHYGGISGTTQAAGLATTSADFTFSKGANNSVQFTFPKIAYEEFPAEPDPGGDPVVASVRARAQRHTSGLVTAVVKHQ